MNYVAVLCLPGAIWVEMSIMLPTIAWADEASCAKTIEAARQIANAGPGPDNGNFIKVDYLTKQIRAERCKAPTTVCRLMSQNQADHIAHGLMDRADRMKEIQSAASCLPKN